MMGAAASSDARTANLANECWQMLLDLFDFRYTAAVFSFCLSDGRVKIDDTVVESADLHNYLRRCEKAAFFAATLGAATDRLIMRYSALSIDKAAGLHAAATVMLEQHCDRVMSELPGLLGLDPLLPAARFSPGYGDFSLDFQPFIIDILRADKKIGIALTEAGMLLPAKSITAVVGFSFGTGPNSGCSQCPHSQCEFREV